jgi:hypothetical protein
MVMAFEDFRVGTPKNLFIVIHCSVYRVHP